MNKTEIKKLVGIFNRKARMYQSFENDSDMQSMYRHEMTCLIEVFDTLGLEDLYDKGIRVVAGQTNKISF